MVKNGNIFEADFGTMNCVGLYLQSKSHGFILSDTSLALAIR